MSYKNEAYSFICVKAMLSTNKWNPRLGLGLGLSPPFDLLLLLLCLLYPLAPFSNDGLADSLIDMEIFSSSYKIRYLPGISFLSPPPMSPSGLLMEDCFPNIN